MSHSNTARTRNPRHLDFNRRSRSGNLLNWLGRMVTKLTGTGALNTITATNATNRINETAHGLSTGDGPFVLSSTTALPTGLDAATRYWISNPTTNDYQLALSREGAIAGEVVGFTDDGSGTISRARAAEASADIMDWNKGGHKPVRIEQVADIDSL